MVLLFYAKTAPLEALLKQPAISEQLRNNGFEVIAKGPEGMQRRIDDEVPKWRDVIARAGIKPV